MVAKHAAKKHKASTASPRRVRAEEIIIEDAVPLLATGGAHDASVGRRIQQARLIQSGFNALEVSRLLGHASPAFTLKVYGHLFDDHESRADRLRRINLLPDQLRDANPGTPGSAARHPASVPGT